MREINGGNGIRGGTCSTEPVRTAGPSMTLVAAGFDPELVEDWGEVVGNEHEFQRERWTAAVRIPSRAMHELYLLPFEMAVRDAQAATIMCAFPHLNFDYVCDSQGALVKTLRERWGFDGWIESDRRAMHSTVDAMLAGATTGQASGRI